MLYARSSRFAVAALALVFLAGTARGEDPLAEAKEHFRRGVALYEAGDYFRALEEFQRSRALVPSPQNTTDLALCLEALDRPDEALEAYDEVIARFSSTLGPEERARIAARVGALQHVVALVDVSSNVNGQVVIDGRPRAKLPLAAPIRVAAGHHALRVVAQGYVTFESSLDVAKGERVAIDARLVALAASGGLRVEDPALPDAEVSVDGAVVGNAPWEGLLQPGVHLVATRKEGRGSAPVRAVVVAGQTALVRVKSGDLGPRVRIVARPSSAQITLDGVVVGSGRWEGALPTGAYQVDAAEDGYFPRRARLEVRPGMAAPEVVLDLAVDAASPRWPHARGHFWFAGELAYGLSASLRSAAEESCPGACSRSGPPAGALFAVRGGYELPFATSLEVAAGYAYFETQLTRTIARPSGPLRIDDDVTFQGFWLAIGASQRVPLGKAWSLRPRLAAGFVVAHANDPLVAYGASASATGDTAHGTPFFASAELGVERAFGPWHIGLSLATFYVPAPGPASAHTVDGGNGFKIANERAYGPFFAVLPGLTIAWHDGR